MNVKTLLAAVLGFGMLASIASAGFVYTIERKASTTYPGFDNVQFYIRNDGLDGTGTLIQSTDYTAEALTTAEAAARGVSGAPQGAVKLQFTDLAATTDDIADANIIGALGAATTFPWTRTGYQPGSAMRLGAASPTYWSTTNMSGTTFVKAGYDSSSPLSSNGDPSTDPAFQNVKGIRITYSIAGSGVTATSTNPSTTNGQGYLAAALVVPTGVYVRFSGNVAGSVTGSTRTFDVSDVPEPGTMSLLGLGAVALLGRRNRKTA